ncbi:glutamine cyclotransferase [Corallococcus sp. H22C18031201]|nr:glutamine cyclotransferase [Corallococcus sp. H22C18031201]
MDKPRDDEDTQPAELLREYGPFPGTVAVHGVTHDGEQVWFASGESLHSMDPVTGKLERSFSVPCDAGTAFDGEHLFQLGEGCIRKLDPKTGRVLKTLPAPGQTNASGLAWAEGSLWMGQYRSRTILQVDPETGAVLRTIQSNRFVTGVTWVEGELWHGTWEDGASEIRRIDPADGRVLTRLAMPEGKNVSGLESDGRDTFYAGGGASGMVRAVKRPSRSRR